MGAHFRVYFRCDHYDRATKQTCQREGNGIQDVGGELRLPVGWKAFTYFDPTCQCDMYEYYCDKHKDSK